MPPSPVPRPGRVRALRRGSRYFTAPPPAANQRLRRCAPPAFAHGLHVTPPRAFGISAASTAPRSRRAAALGLRPIPSRSQPRLRRRRAHRAQLRSSLVPQSAPAGRMGLCQTLPAALASRGRPGTQASSVPLAASPAPPRRPSRPSPIRPCPTKRAGWENGIVPNTPSRARVARPPWNSGLVSPARILAYAAAAPVAPSSIWPCSRIAQTQNGTADILDAARAVREFRSRVARGLRQLASAVRLSKNHRVALTHRPKAHSGHDINLG